MEGKKTVEVSDVTRELQVRLDELMAPLHFQELLEMAEEVCLTHTPNYPGEFSPVGEAAIVAQLGTRGIKAALELSQGHLSISSDGRIAGHEFENEYKRPITIDTPIRIVEAFSDSVDMSILAKAEAFGSQMMAESFRVLGQDAYQKVAEFKQATTKEDQMEVVYWLNERLHIIGHRDIDEDNEIEEHDIYHPARLSPKLLGVYPDMNLTPTCLSVSIIAAEFFKRAGADVLHADVAQRKIEEVQFATAHYIGSLETTMKERFGFEVPQVLSASLRNVFNETWGAATRDEAHHAAVYARLIDGTWMQFDSNYSGTVTLKRHLANTELTDTYNDIQATKSVVPGIEVSHNILTNMGIPDIADEILNEEPTESALSLIITAYAELLDDSTESFGQRIYDKCVAPFFETISGNKRLDTLKYVLGGVTVNLTNGMTEQGIQHEYYKLLDKYVLWGESLETVLQRCQQDRNYRLNRVMDIATLPFIILAKLAAQESSDLGYYKEHSLVEVGSPEQRIGLAVLSDFAAYTDSPLTPGFWISHWPGNVSIIESLHDSPQNSHQDSLISNNVALHHLHPLTSKRNEDIIQTFLEPRKKKKENEDGTENSES